MKKQNNWRLLADLNISIKTVNFLRFLGYDIERVQRSISEDDNIVELAKLQNRTIITFDKDFGEIYYFHKKKSFTVIVLYLRNQTSDSANRVLNKFLEETTSEEIKNKLIILYEYRYRIIR